MERVKVTTYLTGEERFELIVYGELDENEGCAVVSYTEELVSGKKTDVRLLIFGEEVVMERVGELQTTMRFQLGGEFELPIVTEMGSMDAVLLTENFGVKKSEKGYRIFITYKLRFGDFETSHRVFFNIEKLK